MNNRTGLDLVVIVEGITVTLSSHVSPASYAWDDRTA